MRKSLIRVLASLTLVGVALFSLAGPLANEARAGCISAEVYYQALGESTRYVIGPKACIVGTPFTECAYIPVEGGEPSLLVVGMAVWPTCPV